MWQAIFGTEQQRNYQEEIQEKELQTIYGTMITTQHAPFQKITVTGNTA